jgi:aspartyl-tRNA(Asn)/glutamyl-tRNA(Gln) amidotransferase subunit C
MASPEDVKKLAALARLSIDEADLEKFSAEFDSVLKYVGQIESLDIKPTGEHPPVRNVFREDGEPHEPGKYTEAIAAEFPERSGNALRVKKIITHD